MGIQYGEDETNRKKREISNLPKDILLKSLEKFSVHTLNDLRRVCPQWSKSILDSDFANYQISRSESGILILDRENWDTKCDTYLMEIEEGKIVVRDLCNKLSHIVVASCNGLVLIKHVSRPRDFCVANLLTKKSVVLPTNPENKINWMCHYYGLSFVPTKNEYKVTASGLGCGGGKLITLPYTGEIWLEGYFFVCEILTVGTTAWRGVLFSLDGFTWKDILDGTNISVNGVLYFKIILKKEMDGICHLISVDMASETLEMIPFPKGIQVPVAILEIGGFMALADKHEDVTIEWGIWSLRDIHTKEWVKQYCIATESATKFSVRSSYFDRNDYSAHNKYSAPEDLKFIGSLKNGRLFVFLLSSAREAPSYYAYDVKTGQMKRLKDLKAKKSHQYVQHVNSLASC